MDNLWRLTHDPVRHTLTARKPMVVNTTKLSLKKGVPVKVLWPKVAVTRAAAADAAAAGAGEEAVMGQPLAVSGERVAVPKELRCVQVLMAEITQ